MSYDFKPVQRDLLRRQYAAFRPCYRDLTGCRVHTLKIRQQQPPPESAGYDDPVALYVKLLRRAYLLRLRKYIKVM